MPQIFQLSILTVWEPQKVLFNVATAKDYLKENDVLKNSEI